MDDNKDAFDKARDELVRRKNKAEKDAEERRNLILSSSPDYVNIARQMAEVRKEYCSFLHFDPNIRQQKLAELKERSLALEHEERQLLAAITGDEDFLKPRYICPLCKDSGKIDGVRCSCFTRLIQFYASEAIMSKCDIKLNDFSEFDLSLYPTFFNVKIGDKEEIVNPRKKMQGVYTYCQNYANNFETDSPSLLLIGRTGLGKTFLSSCIAKVVMQKGYNVIFGSISMFIRKIEDNHFGKESNSMFENLIGCELLILDDFGSEFKTQFTEAIIYEIINLRINANKPTIISTNYSMPELEMFYNQRIISRISGCFTPLLFIGKDIRAIKLQSGAIRW